MKKEERPIKAGIYMLAWPDGNEYFYFGQSQNLWNRRGQHFRHLKNGTHDNIKLQNVFNKYGLPEFIFVDLCEISDLNEKEQSLLDTFICFPGCCNISKSNANNRGSKQSEDTKKLLSQLMTGRKLSAEHKENITSGLLRRTKNGYAPKRLFGKENPFFGKKHSDETRSRMYGKSKGLGAANIKARLTLNLETGIYYDYAGEAAATININPQYLRRYLNGDRKNPTSFIYV